MIRYPALQPCQISCHYNTASHNTLVITARDFRRCGTVRFHFIFLSAFIFMLRLCSIAFHGIWRCVYMQLLLLLWLCSHLLGFCRLFSFLILYTGCRPPWSEWNQPVARPLPTLGTTQTCLDWDSNPRPQCSWGRNSSCLRPRGHCERHKMQ
jgi:hypothetical protein